jgi:hypothetical protein
MRATAAPLYLSYHFLVTSLREQTGVRDNLSRCVCTAAPPVVVAPPVAPVNDLPDGTLVDDLGLD